MKIGIIQPNHNAGDFSRNVRSLIENYRLCLDQGAELVVSPAMSLCGPGLGDLVFRSAYGRQNRDAVTYLSREIGDIPLLVGSVSPPDDEQLTVPNHAIHAITNNKVQILTRNVMELNGLKLAISMTEDDGKRISPGSCDIALNLPVTSWSMGSFESTLETDIALASRLSCPVIRVSPSGGQERALYGGGSTAVNASARLINRLACFEEDCAVIDMESSPRQDNLPTPLEQIRLALVMGIRDYVRKSGFSSICLGLSGGIDSALVAALAADALGPENVHGLAMPGPYSSKGSVDDAYALARNLGISCQTVGISSTFSALKESMLNVFAETEEGLTEENMQARIRGLMLMSFSNKFNHLLLSTGNKSEASVGFCTMYGDTCGALLPIGDLYKTEVYALSSHINATSSTGERIPASTITKPPSAELRPGQVDRDSLPEYEILDAILRELVENNVSATDLADRGQFEEATVRRVQRLLKTSEWKRAQAPPILDVSSKAFGPGRKIPSIYKFSD